MVSDREKGVRNNLSVITHSRVFCREGHREDGNISLFKICLLS